MAGGGGKGCAAADADDGGAFGRIYGAEDSPGQKTADTYRDQTEGGYDADALDEHQVRENQRDADEPPFRAVRGLH